MNRRDLFKLFAGAVAGPALAAALPQPKAESVELWLSFEFPDPMPQYVFVSQLTGAPHEVLIGQTLADCERNFMEAIVGDIKFEFHEGTPPPGVESVTVPAPERGYSISGHTRP